jgi:hypothetical protein
VKTKTDLAVNQFCKIQTLKSRRFESRLGFLARFAQFAKVPRVFTQPRPIPVIDRPGLITEMQTFAAGSRLQTSGALREGCSDDDHDAGRINDYLFDDYWPRRVFAIEHSDACGKRAYARL